MIELHAWKQATFNKVAAALLKQGCASVDNDDGFACMYFSGNNSCAVGHLIPEGCKTLVREKFNRDKVACLPEYILGKLVLPNFRTLSIKFLLELQRAHDTNSCTPAAWEMSFIPAMKLIANEHNLSAGVLKEKHS